ncbi:MAG TPA: hypothetical protein VHZ24_10715 [Pirellulales bacterium]|nr:hypothetical protein [Pirellulales bacterium]
MFLSAPNVRGDVELPRPAPENDISISADSAQRWNQGNYEVWVLRGNCALRQGPMTARSREAVFWILRTGEYAERQNLVIAYLEGDVHIDYQRAGFPYQLDDKTWFGELFNTATVDVRAASVTGEPKIKPPLFDRAAARRDPATQHAIRRTQFQPFDAQATPPIDPLPAGTRRLRAYPRNNVQVQAQWFPNPATNEWIAVITSGVNLIIDGVGGTGTIDILADRLVLWTKGTDQPDLSGQSLQGDTTPLEIYMEGHVVFRQGDRTIYANRVYHDVNNEVGTLLEADVLAPMASYLGLVRLRSDLIRQTGPNQFYAQKSTVTSSRFENPGYRLQASDVFFEDNQRPVVTPYTGAPVIDPATGEPAVNHVQTLTSTNNFVFIGPVPVFYWPRFATDLEQQSFILRKISYGIDGIMGDRYSARLGVFELLGVKQKPAGTDWIAGPDYLTKRGLGAGTTFRYSRNDFFGIPGLVQGNIDAWGIHDKGVDTLGSDRLSLTPEERDRGRIKATHRQYLADGWRVSGELWDISDRNFLEQYYEKEWDTNKDFTTGVELKRLVDNTSYNLQVDTQLNTFLTTTEKYPRGEHFMFGTPLLGDRLTWHEHTSLGYERMMAESWPDVNSVDTIKQQPLPWEVTSQGSRLITRNEIDAPFDIGPVKFVPYGLGELGHWGQDLQGNSFDRAYGQAGLRASIPFWSVNPGIDSTLFNVHGIAHKIVLDADVYAAGANRSLLDLPLYDPLDDDSGELFRRRMRYNTYGLPAVVTYPTLVGPPAQYDPRLYALRTGMGSMVAAPSMEIAGDIAAARLSARQRWQTKRGPPDRRKIIDWMVLDAGATIFPDPVRDDFGQTIGLVNFDYRWHVGDRLTLLSNGLYDFFAGGQKVTTVAAALNRPPRGQVYLALYSLNGPITSDAVSLFYNYRMSPKWMSSIGISYDLAGAGLIGNQLSLTRIGESFLTNFQFVADPYKNNVGANFMLEPRMLPRSRLGNVGGQQIGLSGMQGLE